MLDFSLLFTRQELARYNAEMAAFEVPRASVKLVNKNKSVVTMLLLCTNEK